MEPDNNMTARLWDYIDGECSEAQKTEVAMLITADATWHAEYDALMSMHTALPDIGALEQPSMRFTANVMEAVLAAKTIRSARLYINRLLIKGIATFFITTIAATLIYAFASVSWGSTAPIMPQSLKISPLNLDGILTPGVIYGFLLVNTLLALLLIDSLLRKRYKS